MTVPIVPVLHIQEGRLVNPDGSPRREPVLETARSLSKEHGRVYLVDMDGLARNNPDVALLQEVARRATVWMDTGPRIASDAMDMFITGADAATVRWRLLANQGALLEAAAVAESLFLAVEFDETGFMANRDIALPLQEVLKMAQTEGLGLVVVDRARAGTRRGLRKEVAQQVRGFPGEKWFAGGIRGTADVAVLGELGFAGALVSTALLEGGLQ